MQRATRQAGRLVQTCYGLLAGCLLVLAVDSGAAHAESSFTLAVHGDRLTVQVDRVPLGRVLSELARQARMRVHLPQSMQADPISDAFADLPLEQGISRLLQGRSFAIFHGNPSPQSGPSADIALTHLWVLPKQEQRRPVLAAADEQEAWSRPAFLEDADPTRRLAALDGFADRHDMIGIDTLAQAMVDADETVRAKAQALFDQALLQSGAPSAQVPGTRK